MQSLKTALARRSYFTALEENARRPLITNPPPQYPCSINDSLLNCSLPRPARAVSTEPVQTRRTVGISKPSTKCRWGVPRRFTERLAPQHTQLTYSLKTSDWEATVSGEKEKGRWSLPESHHARMRGRGPCRPARPACAPSANPGAQGAKEELTASVGP